MAPVHWLGVSVCRHLGSPPFKKAAEEPTGDEGTSSAFAHFIMKSYTERWYLVCVCVCVFIGGCPIHSTPSKLMHTCVPLWFKGGKAMKIPHFWLWKRLPCEECPKSRNLSLIGQTESESESERASSHPERIIIIIILKKGMSQRGN